MSASSYTPSLALFEMAQCFAALFRRALQAKLRIAIGRAEVRFGIVGRDQAPGG